VPFLLDTMTFIRAFADGVQGMPKRVQKLLSAPDEEFFVSTISLSEIAIKTSVGKLNFSINDVQDAITDMGFRTIGYGERDVKALFFLPFFKDHKDPFDRMLIATALAQEIPIIGSDKHFKKYKGLQIIWN
jgi:PIN domain nuclease of toxin-antitoxin system